MRAKGSGRYNIRDITKILKSNGYSIVNQKKHIIFRNTDGDIISIPRNCKDSIVKYEFKHHNIKEDM